MLLANMVLGVRKRKLHNARDPVRVANYGHDSSFSCDRLASVKVKVPVFIAAVVGSSSSA